MSTRKDMKHALGTGLKPDITHVRSTLLNYVARACEYGSAKYERSNFLRPAAGDARADFERLRAYLRAAESHIIMTLDAMELHQAGDPDLIDVEWMRRACYAEDTDYKPGQAVGASGLPHLCGAAASLMMALEQAANAGLLPRDPGRPWERAAESPGPGDECVHDNDVLDHCDECYMEAREKDARVYGEFGDARGYE